MGSEEYMLGEDLVDPFSGNNLDNHVTYLRHRGLLPGNLLAQLADPDVGSIAGASAVFTTVDNDAQCKKLAVPSVSSQAVPIPKNDVIREVALEGALLAAQWMPQAWQESSQDLSASWINRATDSLLAENIASAPLLEATAFAPASSSNYHQADPSTSINPIQEHPEETVHGTQTKWLLRWLAHMAQQEVRGGVESLSRLRNHLLQALDEGMRISTPVPVRTRGSVLDPTTVTTASDQGRAQGEMPEAEKRIGFQGTAQVVAGRLTIHLVTPAEYVGCIAIVSLRARETMPLGRVAVEASGISEGRIDLEIDLAALGAALDDGRLPQAALNVVIESVGVGGMKGTRE